MRPMAKRIVGAVFIGEVNAGDDARVTTAIKKRCVIVVDAGIKHGDTDTRSVQTRRAQSTHAANGISAGGGGHVSQADILAIKRDEIDVSSFGEIVHGLRRDFNGPEVEVLQPGASQSTVAPGYIPLEGRIDSIIELNN